MFKICRHQLRMACGSPRFYIALFLGYQNYIHASGNECSFGCVINCLSKEDAAYREDLAEALYTAGSISGKHIC